MLSLWSAATGLLILIGFLTFIMISPLPTVIVLGLAHLIQKVRPFFLATLAIFGLALYRSYIGFTVHYPFVTIGKMLTVEQVSSILSKHYKHQRNFYIAAFALTMNLILLRVVQIYIQKMKIEEELSESKQQKKQE